jgi:gluconokinase
MSMAALRLPSELPAVVVMGVSGCGKSTVGRALAAELGATFIEGDSLHPAANVEKMSSGIPLEDTDRIPWLSAVGEEIGRLNRSGRVVVAACSALKRRYRETLRAHSGCALVFVMLEGTRAVIAGRLGARKGHFMPPALLDSQFAALEPPGIDERAIRADVSLSLEDILTRVMAGLAVHSRHVAQKPVE